MDRVEEFLSKFQSLLKEYDACFGFGYIRPEEDDCPVIVVRDTQLYYMDRHFVGEEDIHDYSLGDLDSAKNLQFLAFKDFIKNNNKDE